MRMFTLLVTMMIALSPMAEASAMQPRDSAPSHDATMRQGSGRSFGVYQGNGCDGVKRLGSYVSWLGRDPDFVLDFFASDSWQSMQGDASWTVKCWAKQQRKVVFSVPMLINSKEVSLADGAAGKYDDQFTQLAQLLVANGYGDAIIRLGWEFNGGWYPWAAKKDPENWVKYWQRIVTTMRNVKGSAFRFDWCSAQGYLQIPADKVYPGDDYVDIIGRDTYNQTWASNANTPEQRWNDLLTQPYGLNWLAEFARKHNKPISIPEWATGTRPDGHGGGDDGFFIERMAQWMDQNNVIYHSYWDYPAKDYNGKLSDGSKPQAGQALLQAFGGRDEKNLDRGDKDHRGAP